MKPVIRYQSQLLFRKSYKPNCIVRARPARKALRLLLRDPGRNPITYEDKSP